MTLIFNNEEKILLTQAKNFLKEDDGVTAVEYAVVAAGICAIVSVIFASNGPVEKMLTDVFTTISTKVESIISGN